MYFLSPIFAAISCYAALARAGFRRYANYRLARVVGLVAELLFRLLSFYLLAALFVHQEYIEGYNLAKISTFVWLGQSLASLTLTLGPNELSSRIQNGDVVIDFSRPWNLQIALLAEHCGKVGYYIFIQIPLLIAFGATFFPFFWPKPESGVILLFSAILSFLLNFGIRFLLALSTFWLLDEMGPASLCVSILVILGGYFIPIQFFPDGLVAFLWFTPIPALSQNTINIALEHGSVLFLLGHQIIWVIIVLGIGGVVLRAAARRLVVQGG